MALVAYGSSSESEDELDNESIPQIKKLANATKLSMSQNVHTEHGSISSKNISDNETELISNNDFKLNLPQPKSLNALNENDEKDDEFLRKKEIPIPKPQPPPPMPSKRTGTVKITIPSLSEFKEDRSKDRSSAFTIGPQKSKPCGLLGMLPKPKSFKLIIPHRKAAAPTSSAKLKKSLNKSMKNEAILSEKPTVEDIIDNDDDNDESVDFFSLNSKYDVLEECQQTIKDMVAEKVASIGQAAKKLQQKPLNESQTSSYNPEELTEESTSKMDQNTINALCGSTAKRARIENVDVIELSADQVLPDRNEWLRHQLQAQTEYQPRGLVDEEPAAGTRKKHQITYLAHQAKANEQELQAMWASNRHARRLTQNKYGF